MMYYRLFAIIAFLCIGLQFTNAQMGYIPQRGQRGYIPPNRTPARMIHVEKDVQQELEKILPVCVSAFSLDDFEKGIFRQLLTRKIERENAVIRNEDIKPEDRSKQFLQIEKTFQEDLKAILTDDEIEQYLLIDFSKENRQDKKEKRKRRKKNKS